MCLCTFPVLLPETHIVKATRLQYFKTFCKTCHIYCKKLCHRITGLNSEILPSCAPVHNYWQLHVLTCLMMDGDGIVRCRLLTFRGQYTNFMKRLLYTTTRTMESLVQIPFRISIGQHRPMLCINPCLITRQDLETRTRESLC